MIFLEAREVLPKQLQDNAVLGSSYESLTHCQLFSDITTVFTSSTADSNSSSTLQVPLEITHLKQAW